MPPANVAAMPRPTRAPPGPAPVVRSFFRMQRATAQPLQTSYIYIHAERGQFSRQRQAAGPACPDGPAAPMRRRCATTARQACRSAGVWLAWWPGGITAGAGPPGCGGRDARGAKICRCMASCGRDAMNLGGIVRYYDIKCNKSIAFGIKNVYWYYRGDVAAE